MKFHLYPTIKVRIVLLLLANYSFAAGQSIFKMSAPKEGHIPAAFSRRGGSEVHFKMAQNNQYILAHTDKEAKVWKMPEGILVYRHQMDQNLGSVAWSVIKSVNITSDGKYVYTSGGTQSDLVLFAASLETGMELQNGPVLDSLKAGTYQMVRGVRSKDEVPPAMFANLQNTPSLILPPRPYKYDDLGGTEGIEFLVVVQDKTTPGAFLIVSEWEYCQGGKWLQAATKKMGDDFKEYRKMQKKKWNCQLKDYHISRYFPATGSGEYIGKIIPGVEQVDYTRIESVYPSPFGDVVVVRFQGADSLAIYSVRGVPLWSTPTGEKWKFDHWDDQGNLMIRILGEGLKYHYSPTNTFSLRRPFTGALIKEYQLAKPAIFCEIIDEWGMLVDIQYSEDDFTIGLYSIEDGRRMIALTDAEGAAKFSKAYQNEAEVIKRQYEANVAANERAYVTMQEAHRQARLASYAAEKEKLAANAAASAEHAKYFEKCSKCAGTGGEYVEDFYITYSSTLLGESKFYTTSQVNATKHISPYKKFQSCTRCWGKGEIRR